MPRAYRLVLHDRDSIYSSGLDTVVTALGVRVLRTLVQASQAHAFCERLLGSPRHECLDFLALLGEEHLRQLLCAWKMHYNRGRLHASLGPGLPESPPRLPAPPITGHRLPRNVRFVARPILGALHHEYGLEKLAA